MRSLILLFYLLLLQCVMLSKCAQKVEVIRGRTNSLFGYSLSFHQENNITKLLVGSPNSNTPQIKYGIKHPGAVYQCDPNDKPVTCSQIQFDKTGNNVDRGIKVDEKSNQWFGATIASLGSNGVIACAPRYVFYSSNNQRREPVGTCFTAKNRFTEISEISPCRTKKWGFHKQGYCQVGSSAIVTKDAFYIGAVGSRYWQGQIFSKSISGVLKRHWNFWNQTNDYQYLGYTLNIGTFFDSKPNIVISAPRSAKLYGRVHILSSELKVLYTFTGEQIGSYFGHSLAIGDLNGDGMDDLIIGAPLFSKSKFNYESGRVYIIFREKKGMFKQWSIIDSKASQSRFGFSLATLGDLNSDGKTDFAVGAPSPFYVNQGRVYLFHGKELRYNEYFRPFRTLIPMKSSMTISFGFSIHSISRKIAKEEEEPNSENDDEDSSTQIAVGAPISNKVFLFTIKC